MARRQPSASDVGFDPRITPAREDLAAAYLKDRVVAPRYVSGTLHEVASALAPMHREPDLSAPVDTELLMGERVTVYDAAAGWAWAQAEHDRYVGYVLADALARPHDPPTHKVMAPASRLYLEPSAKALASAHLSFGCRLRIPGERGHGAFARVITHAGERYVPLAHIAPIAARAPDFVGIAEGLVGVPYLWGGRSSLGIDCSALVQLSLAAAGVAAPRDSDHQRLALGVSIGGPGQLGSLSRGDLIFWDSHVAIALDARRIVHANAKAMAVSIDDLIAFAGDAEESAGPIREIKRLARD